MDRPTLIVELVGPAGAGKTTLSQALSQHSKILIGAPPYVRRIGHTPFFVRNAFLLLPTLLHLYQDNCTRLTRREIAWMIILKGWHHILEQEASNNDIIIVLDQGPVFMLTQLYGLSPESLKNQSAEKWWESAINRWAATLDMVIWLDASDAILVERIRTRNKWHLAKEKSKQGAFEFLARYRTAYEQVISMLTVNTNGPKVLRFDTAQESLDEIVNRVLVVFDLENSEDIVAC